MALAPIARDGVRVGALDLTAVRIESDSSALTQTWASLVQQGVPRWSGGVAPDGGFRDQRTLVPVGPESLGLAISALEDEGYDVAWDEPLALKEAGEQIAGNLCRDERGQWAACGEEGPNVYKTKDDVVAIKDFGQTKYFYRGADGKTSGWLAPGAPLEKAALPETLYHATTRMDALMRAPFLKGQHDDAGLGGGTNAGVSLTTSRADAVLIATELRRGHEIVTGIPTAADASEEWFRTTLTRYAREDETAAGLKAGALQSIVDDASAAYHQDMQWRQMHAPERLGEQPSSPAWDRFRGYLTGRDHFGSRSAGETFDAYKGFKLGESPLRNPLLLTDIDTLKELDPRKIGVIEVPRAGIPDQALMLPGDDYLHEVRVHADVPIKGSGSTELYSPNVAEEAKSTPDKAERDRESEHFKKFEGVAHEIDQELGLDTAQASAYGDWNGGSEASLLARVKGEVPWETLRYAAALKGLAGHQKAVGIFHAEPDGQDALHEFTLPVADWREARTLLASRGIENRTLIPTEGGTRVILIDQGGALADTVFKIGEDYDVGIKTQIGKADFLGDFADRDAAGPIFEREIAGYVQAYPDRRHARVRHPDRAWLVEAARARWRRYGRLSEAGDFDPDLHPRDEKGQWAEKPGGAEPKAKGEFAKFAKKHADRIWDAKKHDWATPAAVGDARPLKVRAFDVFRQRKDSFVRNAAELPYGDQLVQEKFPQALADMFGNVAGYKPEPKDFRIPQNWNDVADAAEVLPHQLARYIELHPTDAAQRLALAQNYARENIGLSLAADYVRIEDMNRAEPTPVVARGVPVEPIVQPPAPPEAKVAGSPPNTRDDLRAFQAFRNEGMAGFLAKVPQDDTAYNTHVIAELVTGKFIANAAWQNFANVMPDGAIDAHKMAAAGGFLIPEKLDALRTIDDIKSRPGNGWPIEALVRPEVVQAIPERARQEFFNRLQRAIDDKIGAVVAQDKIVAADKLARAEWDGLNERQKWQQGGRLVAQPEVIPKDWAGVVAHGRQDEAFGQYAAGARPVFLGAVHQGAVNAHVMNWAQQRGGMADAVALALGDILPNGHEDVDALVKDTRGLRLNSKLLDTDKLQAVKYMGDLMAKPGNEQPALELVRPEVLAKVPEADRGLFAEHLQLQVDAMIRVQKADAPPPTDGERAEAEKLVRVAWDNLSDTQKWEKGGKFLVAEEKPATPEPTPSTPTPPPTPEEDTTSANHKYQIDSWDVMPGDLRDEAFEKWKDANRSDFIRNEQDQWHENEDEVHMAQVAKIANDDDAVNDAIAKALVAAGASEESVERAKEAVGGELWLSRPEATQGRVDGAPWGKYGGFKSGDDLLDPEVLDHLEFENGKPWGEKDPNQGSFDLPNTPHRDPEAERDAFRERVHEAALANLYKAAEDVSVDAPDSDYFADQVDEYMNEIWGEKDDSEKWDEVSRWYDDVWLNDDGEVTSAPGGGASSATSDDSGPRAAKGPKVRTDWPKEPTSNSPVETTLRTGPASDVKELRGNSNVNKVYKGVIGGVKVIIKPVAEHSHEQFRDGIRVGADTEHELAAQIINDAMGRPVDMPIVAQRDFGDIEGPNGKLGHALVGEFKPGQNISQSANRWQSNDEDAANIGLLDSIIGNGDRHGNNALVENDDHIIAIDHGLAFPVSNSPFEGRFGAIQARAKNLTDAEAERMQGLVKNRAELEVKLKPYLNDEEMDALWERIETIAESKRLYTGFMR